MNVKDYARLGRLSYEQGVASFLNPYKAKTWRHLAWRNGWTTALRRAQASGGAPPEHEGSGR